MMGLQSEGPEEERMPRELTNSNQTGLEEDTLPHFDLPRSENGQLARRSGSGEPPKGTS